MRQRTELLAGFAGLIALAVLAAVVAKPGTPATDAALRPSTFVAGPGGAEALLDAVRRLDIPVRRFRERPVRLGTLEPAPRRILLILEPDAAISAPELTQFTAFSASADLLVAGKRTDHLMRCFGYRIDSRPFDSVRVTGLGPQAPRVTGALVATHATMYVDTTRIFDAGRAACHVPAYRSVTTLLTSPRGTVALRLERADNGHAIILVADAGLFDNRNLRDTDAGTWVLGLLAGQYDRVIFEEYHHGYGASGSLAAATLDWSRRSPWGWMVWQLAGVGVVALIFGAIRFGPPVAVIGRRRRSPLEHVRALATALAAAHGHDEAIAAMVRGLRRRLVPPALRTRGDWRAWLNQLRRRSRSPDEQAAVASLSTLVEPGQPAASVLRAANAVEDLWQILQH